MGFFDRLKFWGSPVRRLEQQFQTLDMRAGKGSAAAVEDPSLLAEVVEEGFEPPQESSVDIRPKKQVPIDHGEDVAVVVKKLAYKLSQVHTALGREDGKRQARHAPINREQFFQQINEVTAYAHKAETDYHLAQSRFMEEALGPTFRGVYGQNAKEAIAVFRMLTEDEDPRKFLEEWLIIKEAGWRKKNTLYNVLGAAQEEKLDLTNPEGARRFGVLVLKEAPELLAQPKGFKLLGYKFRSYRDRVAVAEALDENSLLQQKYLQRAAQSFQKYKIAESRHHAVQQALVLAQPSLDDSNIMEQYRASLLRKDDREHKKAPLTAAPEVGRKVNFETPETLRIKLGTLKKDPKAHAQNALNEAAQAWEEEPWAASIKRQPRYRNQKQETASEALGRLQATLLKTPFRELNATKQQIVERYGPEVWDAILVKSILEASAQGHALPGKDRAEEMIMPKDNGKTELNYERLSGVKGKYLSPALLDEAFSALAKTPYASAVDSTALATVSEELREDTFPDGKLKGQVMSINIEPESLGDPTFFSLDKEGQVSGTLVDYVHALAKEGKADKLILEVTQRGHVDMENIYALAVLRGGLQQAYGTSFKIAVDYENSVKPYSEAALARLRPDIIKADANLNAGWGKPPLSDEAVVDRLDTLVRIKGLAESVGAEFVAEKVPEVAGGAKIPVADILALNGVEASGTSNSGKEWSREEAIEHVSGWIGRNHYQWDLVNDLNPYMSEAYEKYLQESNVPKPSNIKPVDRSR